MRRQGRSRSGSVHHALALMLAATASACTFQGPQGPVATSYDFGPTPAYTRSNPAIPGTVLVPSVRAPAWLDDTGVAYRLLYEDSTRPRAYAMSRWAAEPAALITDRLRSRLAAVAQAVVTPAFSARSDYTLRLELEDFTQHFTAPGESRAVMRARGSLLDSDERTLLAQRVFEVERPAAPNAPGGIKALTEATDEFLEQLVKWTAENARGAKAKH